MTTTKRMTTKRAGEAARAGSTRTTAALSVLGISAATTAAAWFGVVLADRPSDSGALVAAVEVVQPVAWAADAPWGAPSAVAASSPAPAATAAVQPAPPPVRRVIVVRRSRAS